MPNWRGAIRCAMPPGSTAASTSRWACRALKAGIGSTAHRKMSTLPVAHPAMPLFWKPYTSEITQFIEEMKAKKPTLEAEQRAGRALLWDRDIDRDEQARYGQARVAQQPYVY